MNDQPDRSSLSLWLLLGVIAGLALLVWLPHFNQRLTAAIITFFFIMALAGSKMGQPIPPETEDDHYTS